MNNIENSVKRSAFFPNDVNSKRKKLTQMQQAALKRNNQERQRELLDLKSRDSRVKIPNAVRDFARIKKTVDAAPAIDNSAKIAQLRNQISKGEYQIDYDALADKMLQSEF
ncbi:MAG: flagellar biosynthesis anti-sigma factor FlgM [Bdellovibrionales bacterium]|jgi:negative regulator of flagellin synthesis FlgM|nr:flagellar biosynthesis anti-sigma factor FlgM [Bdellovibrionales bacterium]MBT3525564.1 flagellar biosynthesis anti-sigma factor FlgM [Bdellovibrionales bacterium]MBT7670270.1 flagellar biosynthesis anti-sigma factor FlgM [Bdellovibrionales bacterium]MBT7767343.1 flagellar biosynthesis anti-sigma factor FlgM [Bdellovibrionales bacterium]